MKKYCDDCGEKVYNGACTNCHEAIYIEDQYIDLEMEVPEVIQKEAYEARKKIWERKDLP